MRQSIVFSNNSILNLEFLTNFGVSVKEDSDSAIGMFGTGLKYAIAVLMREGHEIKIYLGPKMYTIEIERRKVRNREFEFVVLSDNDGSINLGFTTHLGVNWDVWQAYRELASNTYDENGEIELWDNQSDYPLNFDSTHIFVSGDKIVDAYRMHDQIFLDRATIGKPVASSYSVEVFDRPSNHLYYRGIRAFDLGYTSSILINVLDKEAASLTEDRTIGNQYLVFSHAAEVICKKCSDESFIEKVLSNSCEMTKTFDFSWRVLSEPMKNVIERHIHQVDNDVFNQSARKAFYDQVGFDADRSNIVSLDGVKKKMLETAIKNLSEIGYDVSKYKIIVVKSFGKNIVGMAKDGNIYVTLQTFDMGTKFLMSTLLEEFWHLDERLEDCTRAMQNFLFERLMSAYEEIKGEPF